MSRLIDTTDWLVYGIFTAMARNYTLPWSDSIDSQDLDMDYYGNHSGDKITSALVDKLLIDETLTNNNIDKLASIIYHKYKDNWVRAWYALSLEYNPIHNYDGDETTTTSTTYSSTSNGTNTNTQTHDMTVKNTGTVTDNDTITKTGTDTTATTNKEDKNGTDTLTKTGTDTVETSSFTDKDSREEIIKSGKETTNNSKNGSIVETSEVAGYNSSSFSNDNKKTTTYNNYTEPSELTYSNRKDTTTYSSFENGEDNSTTTYNTTDTTTYDTTIDTTNNETVTHNTTDTDNRTTTNDLQDKTTGTVSDSGTNSNSETGNETTTVTTNKGGNLGVTTTQQMLISELDFRASYNFFNNLVYKNVDEVLTSKIY